MEQEEYTKEKIQWSYIDFIDNQDVLDLIEKVLLFNLVILFFPRMWDLFAIKVNRFTWKTVIMILIVLVMISDIFFGYFNFD